MSTSILFVTVAGEKAQRAEVSKNKKPPYTVSWQFKYMVVCLYVLCIIARLLHTFSSYIPNKLGSECKLCYTVCEAGVMEDVFAVTIQSMQ